MRNCDSEGRIRPITAVNTSNTYDAVYKTAPLTLPDNSKASIDYFITDHRSDPSFVGTGSADACLPLVGY